MALMLTKASAIFFNADVLIREKVGREIFILLAASSCLIPSHKESRTASNSSKVRQTPSISFTRLHFGLKQRSPGRHLIHLVFLGLINTFFRYEHLFITISVPFLLVNLPLTVHLFSNVNPRHKGTDINCPIGEAC